MSIIMFLPSVKYEERQAEEGRAKSRSFMFNDHRKAPSIVRTIDRFTCCVFRRFSYLPSNRYLFERFKSHCFNEIKSLEELNQVYEVYKQFILLNQFHSDLQIIGKQIQSANNRLRDMEKKETVEHNPRALTKNLSSDSLTLMSSLLETARGAIKKKSKGKTFSRLEERLDDLYFKSLELKIWNKISVYREAESLWKRSCQSYFKAFDRSSYQTMEEDKAELTKISRFLILLTNYYDFYKRSIGKHKASGFQQARVISRFGELYVGFERIANGLESLYQSELERDEGFAFLIETVKKTIRQGLVFPHNQSEKSVSTITYLSASIKGAMTRVLFYPIKDSHKQTDITWKIDKYEALLNGVYRQINDYLETAKVGSIEEIIRQWPNEELQEWQRFLLPILNAFAEQIKFKKNNFTADHLNELRDCYKEKFLKPLRAAADWASRSQERPGVVHIESLCYGLYTKIDLNSCCADIVRAFCALGSRRCESLGFQPLHQLSRTDHYLISDLESINRFIEAAPLSAKSPILSSWSNSLIGHLNGVFTTPFDSNLANPIHAFFKLTVHENGASREILDIAMGTPTIEYGGKGVAELAPECLAFFNYNQKKDLRHLYINYQDYRSKIRVKGDESVRCRVVHAINQANGLTNNYAVTFSKNTIFYKQTLPFEEKNVAAAKKKLTSYCFEDALHQANSFVPFSIKQCASLKQKGMALCSKLADRIHHEQFGDREVFENEKEHGLFMQRFCEAFSQSMHDKWQAKSGYTPFFPKADAFKQEIILQFFELKPEESGNLIPVDLVHKLNLKAWTEKLSEQIHRILFANRSILNIMETKVWIELIDISLSLKLMISLEINSYNKSCKDRVDRGAMADCLFFIYLAIVNRQEFSNHAKVFLETMTFARSIMVRKRTIVRERLDRLIETAQWMLSHKESVRALHAKIFNGLSISVDLFAEKNGIGLPDSLIDYRPHEASDLKESDFNLSCHL